eukprot:TRINITY_DN55735_c0_g1_i1.p1 TRINITY_DN55735_c0_g1~~TRINITY_DN55735_c0_g1_i1.p1  ORF type:complete len:552 (-),score=38.94 TRINITY_DN55735_c0_g1_i1:68-1723(-)
MQSIVYTGVIKSMNRESGFGFISCRETQTVYACDVFLHKNQAGESGKGQLVSFTVETVRGKPQARNVKQISAQQHQAEDLHNHMQMKPGYIGTVKSVNLSKGFGFISCPETEIVYASDVFWNTNKADSFKPGQQVTFTVEEVNHRPQARDIRAVEDGQPNSPPSSSILTTTDPALEASSVQRYNGTVKSMNLANGFGFISCLETEGVYSCDVFLHTTQAGLLIRVGHCVSFAIEIIHGKPQARDVELSSDEVQKQELAKFQDQKGSKSLYSGTIKSMNFSTGFGFITCSETEAIYSSDVFLHKNQLGGCMPSQRVTFTVEEIDGQPQAREVELVVDAGPQVIHDPMRDLVLNVENSHKRILLIGSGDASLSKALVKETQGRHHIVTTFYESSDALISKYDEVKANLAFLASHEQPVCFNVDACDLLGTLHIMTEQFDIVQFCFPHTGVPNADEGKSVLSNQQLVQGYLVSVCDVLAPGGFAQLVVGSGHPYDKWDVARLIGESPLQLHSLAWFEKSVYPGYVHRATGGKLVGPLNEVSDRDPIVYTLTATA